MHRLILCLKPCLAIFLFISAAGSAQQISDTEQPEHAHQRTANTAVQAQQFMLVTAHPLATQAGYEILARSGHVMDALVTVQTVLGLVEPQSSGLGGGAFALYYDATARTLTSFDARETAPLQATQDLFLDDAGQALGFFEAVVGGRSVGTPGTVKMLWTLQQRYGNQKWQDLLGPALTLAREGFVVSPRLADSVQRDAERLASDKTAAQYFIPNGRPIAAGSLLKNPAYAHTLSHLAEHGDADFYTGQLARKIVAKVQNADTPGPLALEDLATYSMRERTPTCHPYRAFEVCGMGPPSSGAHTVGQILGILEHFNLAQFHPDDPNAWHLIAEASRLAFADRGRYLADPDFVEIPHGLLDKAYLKQRASLVSKDRVMENAQAGNPPGSSANAVSGKTLEQDSTTHFVIVDRAGNILSVTSTIENAFGSRLMVGGFLLNNELTDFSFTPADAHGLVANRVEAGKRPRSSMAPTIVMHGGRPYLALGSPGGSRIINYVANTLIRVLDWGLELQESLDAPHITSRFGVVDLEEDSAFEALRDPLVKLGHNISVRDLNSGLHGVLFHNNTLTGAADPRREGLAMGH